MRNIRLAAVLVFAASILPVRSTTALETPYLELVGSVHEHSSYSDGWPGTTPTTYFESAKRYGLDFLGSGEHSDNADVPVTASDGCLGPALPSCIAPGTDHFSKWDATLDRAHAATTGAFTGFRGFEWTSDRFGHINVYFSRNDANAKADGGYATMETFYRWLTTGPNLGGGADGVATFNHPGAKKLTDEPEVNWNDFAYVPAVDNIMAGLEVFNDDSEYGTSRDVPEGYYVRALDKGWHVGAVGAEDLHGIPGETEDYGSPRWAKTVILSTDRSESSLKAAMQARRMYALRYNDGRRLSFTVDGEVMGSRLVRKPQSAVRIVGTSNRPGDSLEIVTSGGRVVASGTGAVDSTMRWRPSDRYYFMRVKAGDEWVGYSSPVWITPVQTAPVGQWLAGDLHVHTCYSHDAYCPPDDDNTGPEEFYTLSGDVDERFTEASLRGLDYLAITDHNDVRSITDPGFGSHGVLGVRGYEHSLSGHAQVLGVDHLYTPGDGAAGVSSMADAVRGDGGVFQINHPSDQLLVPLEDDCRDTSNLDWGYGFDVRPDTLEVWNIGFHLQPPAPAGNSNDDSLTYWECWLNRGQRIGATGGSDSHWLSTSLVQGPGNPTTWIYAAERSERGVLDALRAGRTSISLVPPVLGGLRLLLEGDADGDGVYEAMIGDDVPPGTLMRVRAEGSPAAGVVEVRANGKTIVDDQLVVGGQAVTFRSPHKAGWVRATLSGPDLRDERAATCDPLVGDQTTYCRNKIVMLALTSPIYLVRPSR
jgi:hypothetical protein